MRSRSMWFEVRDAAYDVSALIALTNGGMSALCRISARSMLPTPLKNRWSSSSSQMGIASSWERCTPAWPRHVAHHARSCCQPHRPVGKGGGRGHDGESNDSTRARKAADSARDALTARLVAKKLRDAHEHVDEVDLIGEGHDDTRAEGGAAFAGVLEGDRHVEVGTVEIVPHQ